MTDQELLEFAAKAAGLNVKAQSVNADDCWIGLIIGEKHTREKKFWNPLADDADALRLAVKLGINIINSAHSPSGISFVYAQKIGYPDCQEYEQDRYVATRRAIVRAAAEIGKSMEALK